MIVITKQVTREIHIEENTLQKYCDRNGFEMREVLDEVRNGELDIEHLSYLITEEEIVCKIRKIN
jgi:hypothetical protein